MKVFLQNSVNLAYFGGYGHWTWQRHGAVSYPSTLLAREECRTGELKDMLLVVSYGDGNPPYDVRIAVDHRGYSTSSPELVPNRMATS